MKSSLVLILVLVCLAVCPGAMISAQSPDPEIPAGVTDPTVFFWWQENTITLAANFVPGDVMRVSWTGLVASSCVDWTLYPDGTYRWVQYINPSMDIRSLWVDSKTPFFYWALESGFPLEWEVVYDELIGKKTLKWVNYYGEIACNGDCSQIWFRASRNPRTYQLDIRVRNGETISIPWEHNKYEWVAIADTIEDLRGQDFFPVYGPEFTDIYLFGGVRRTEDGWYQLIYPVEPTPTPNPTPEPYKIGLVFIINGKFPTPTSPSTPTPPPPDR